VLFSFYKIEKIFFLKETIENELFQQTNSLATTMTFFTFQNDNQ